MMAYNLLLPADAQLVSYEVEEEQHYRCQIMTIIGMTKSGYELVISKIDTSLIAILSSVTDVQQVYCNPRVEPHMTAEETLTAIGFTVQVESEARV